MKIKINESAYQPYVHVGVQCKNFYELKYSLLLSPVGTVGTGSGNNNYYHLPPLFPFPLSL